MSRAPGLYAWLGGAPALARPIDRFYASVPDDPLLGPSLA